MDEKTLLHIHNLIMRAKLHEGDMSDAIHYISEYPEETQRVAQEANDLMDCRMHIGEALMELYDIIEQEIRLIQRGDTHQ